MSNEFAINRNDESARKIGGAGRINATGAYEGVFTRAEARKSESGAIGIEFDFKSNEGASASFLGVWRLNGNGEELSGQRIIDAIMLLLRAKSVNPILAQVDKWDKTTSAVIKQKCLVYQEFMNKPIGLLLQKEHGTYNGAPTEKMIIYGCYDIASKKTPMEIIDKKSAGSLDGIIAALKDKYQKGKSATTHHGTHSGARTADGPHGGRFADMDEDIPF